MADRQLVVRRLARERVAACTSGTPSAQATSQAATATSAVPSAAGALGAPGYHPASPITMWNPCVPQVEGTGHGATLWGLLMFPTRCPHGSATSSLQIPQTACAYQEISKVYATLTAVTGPLFRLMPDGLQGLERAPGPGRR